MTLFEKIIAGEIPCYKIYEDADFFAFLTIDPYAPGHTLVVPKHPYKNLDEIPDEFLGKYLKVVKKIAIKIQKSLKADGYNIIMNNGEVADQSVFHAHIHVIPRFKDGPELYTKSPNLDFSPEDYEEVRRKVEIR